MRSLFVSFLAAALPKPSGISTHSLNLRRIALRNEIMTPLSIWCIVTRIYMSLIQKCGINQNALKKNRPLRFFAAIHNVLQLMENNNSNNQNYYNYCNKTNNFKNTWSRAYVAAVLVPLNDPFAPAAFHKSSRCRNFNTLTNLSHCLDLIISSCRVMRATSLLVLKMRSIVMMSDIRC